MDPTARPPAAARPAPRGRRDPVAVFTVYLTLTVLAAGAVWGGIELRRWVWDSTETARFEGDIRNAYRQGARALDLGYLNTYDALVEKHGLGGRYGCDYAPLRLGVATAWVAWLRDREPGIERWRNQYALTWPLLRLNLFMELAAAGAMFLLVRLWVKRQGDAEGRPSEPRAALWGAAAAGLLWFNPALIVDAHAWPQWDAWALPFFLGAVLAVSLRRYGWAGLLIAVGAMFKGQVLMVAPVLLLIALVRGHWRGVLALPVGFALGTALVASPWLLRDGTALKLAAAGAGVGTLALWAASRCKWHNPWLRTGGCAIAVLCIGGAAWAFGGSFAWFHVGWAGPTENHYAMHMGTCANLAALLSKRWGWGLDDAVAPMWLSFDLPLRTAMVAAYGLTLVWCGVWAGLTSRARSRWFLLAVVSPWVLMFALMPQMHERYLVWGAAASAAFVALGVGPTLIHALVTGLALLQVLIPLLGKDREMLPMIRSFAQGAVPDVAWALLAVCAALLVLMARPGRWKRDAADP